MTAPQVVHNAAARRFDLVIDGQAAHLDYQIAGDRLRLIHIEVPPAIQGHRYSDVLAQAGLEYAKAEHLRVVPICPVVRTFLTHHPEYLPLVDEHWIPILK
jgi:predicted GNAT family acetyltransferase